MTNTTKDREAARQVAFDRGAGHRCITHDRTNPYSEPHLREAWERGWEKTDREANNG